MIDKRMTPKQAVDELIKDGDSICFGGWGSTRKPMAMIREIIRSKKKNLTFMAFGGLDIDILIGAKKIKKLIFPFMSLEPATNAPLNFRRARKEGTLNVMELSEHLFWQGLKAGAERLPFFPSRSGIGTDVLTVNPQIKVITAPYTREKLVAMPAINPDVVILHVNAADPSGWGQILGDPMFDSIMARAAKKTILSAERVVPLSELKQDYDHIEIGRMWVNAVVEAPYGAHPGNIYPEYRTVDEAHLAEYTKASADAESFKAYLNKYVLKVHDNDAYLKLIGKE